MVILLFRQITAIPVLNWALIIRVLTIEYEWNLYRAVKQTNVREHTPVVPSKRRDANPTLSCMAGFANLYLAVPSRVFGPVMLCQFDNVASP